MATYFQMWVECAGENACAALIRHFDSFQTTLLTGRTISWGTERAPDVPAGLIVASSHLSRYGVRTLQDALETTEAGIHLFRHLKNAPDFRFARVGWEIENVTSEDLNRYMEDILPGESRLTIECVMDEPLYKQLGSPQFCYPFRPGYWWTGYRGEHYSPLDSNDQGKLMELYRKLFPECFKY